MSAISMPFVFPVERVSAEQNTLITKSSRFAELRDIVTGHRDSKLHVLEHYHVPKVTGGHGYWTKSRRSHERNKLRNAIIEHQQTGIVKSLKPKLPENCAISIC